MDLLSQRYADPYFFMDGMLQTGRFNEFVVNLVKTVNREKEEKVEWDVYLHKVQGMSFSEYKETIENNKALRNMDKSTIEATVQHSNNILDNFNPDEGGE